MAQPSRRDARTHAYAVADVIRDLIDDERPPVGDKPRWLAERTDLSKDSWHRVLTHKRVLDYSDLVQAADALHITATDIARRAERRVANAVGPVRNHSDDAVPAASRGSKSDYAAVADENVIEVDPGEHDV